MAKIYKNGLYIKDNKIDVENEDLFLFKYTSTNVKNPQAILNSYSKTVTINGTPNNNRIFNNLWRLDATLHNTTLFNPMKREPFEIFENGKLLEAGYVQLNNIKYVKNNPQYDLVLFGMLGDFFYKLMYRDEQQEKQLNLADLNYNLYGINNNVILGEATLINNEYVPTQNINNEIHQVNDKSANAPIFNWNKNYIWNSWLCSFTDKYDNLKHDLWETFVTAIPVYNGYHDDFDNDKILINYNYPQNYENILPTTYTEGEETYERRFNYALLQSQREMDEWEIRDLRSNFQRPGIRFGKLMQIISDYSKEQGYTIQWDADIDITNTRPQNYSTLNEYFWKTYILLDHIKIDEKRHDERALSEIQGVWNSIDEPSTFYLINDITQTEIFDFSSMQSPTIEINMTDEYRPYNFESDVLTAAITNVNGGYNASSAVAHGWENRNNYFGAFIYKIEVLVNDVIDENYSKVLYIYTDNFATTQNIAGYNDLYERLKSVAENQYNTNNFEIIKTSTINATRPADDYHFMIYKDPIKIYLNNLPEENNVKIRITKDFISLFSQAGRYGSFWVPWDFYDLNQPNHTIGTKFIICNADSDGTLKYWGVRYDTCMTMNDAADFKDQYYVQANVFSGSSTSSINDSITKKQLLGNTESPFKYLVDWCKLFNMRFRTDILTKTIYIEQPKNYYLNELVDINDNIDYGKDFVIDPTFVEHNVYKFSIEDEESENYAGYIYKNTNNKEFSSKLIFTNYEFNNEPLKVFDDNIYKSNLDYLLSTPYLNTTLARGGIQYPPMCLMNKYEYTLWNRIDPEKDVTQTLYGLQSFNSLPNKPDNFTKQCFFDREYKPLESNNSLVLFDGLYITPENNNQVVNYTPYMLTDNIELMNNLNDETPCFLNAYYTDEDVPYNINNYWVKRTQTGVINNNNQMGNIGLWSFMLPIIHSSSRLSLTDKYYDKTYYFNIPEDINQGSIYGGENNWLPNSTMYEKWWSNYESDVLDNDSKTVTCSVFLHDEPQSALRKFYYFKNAIWSLLEINDFNFKNKNNTPVKCKFIKVKDMNNYV